jgi:NADPH:quinone reductase-like Zn-dependent oxidoreductase
LEERPEPTPGPGEVLVRIKAASLNYRDLMVVAGGYARGARYPLVPLSDGAGEIAAVGDGVTAWHVGERVISSFFSGWIDGEQTADRAATALGGAVNGVLAEKVVPPAHAVARTPQHMTDAEASTLPCAALTAWHALFEGTDPCARVRPYFWRGHVACRSSVFSSPSSPVRGPSSLRAGTRSSRRRASSAPTGL